jgi:hypothetical protein
MDGGVGGDDEEDSTKHLDSTVAADAAPTHDPDDGDGPLASLDGAVSSDAATTSDSSRDGSSMAGGEGGGSLSCVPRTPLPVCDPVKNMECPVFTQCDIDTEATVQAGRCVIWTLGLIGCNADAVSTTCDATNACVDGACRKLCYCDSDCAADKKCTGTAPGPAGVAKICQ